MGVGTDASWGLSFTRLLCLSAMALSIAGGAIAARPREPDLKTVLRRAADYVRSYHDRLSEIVAEERYVQRTGAASAGVFRPPDVSARREERVLKSDFMLLRGYADENLWIGVREVFEIDGEAAGERAGTSTLLSDTTSVAAQVRRLADQQAEVQPRRLYRTINVPTLALGFLLPDRQPRFRYKRSGSAVVHDTPVWLVTFQERERPTLIRTPEGRDMRSSGTYWIDPRDGAVLRTELHAGENRQDRLSSFILVGFRRHDRFDMLVPDDMNEQYISGHQRIEGHATYSNFRRFEMETRIKYRRCCVRRSDSPQSERRQQRHLLGRIRTRSRIRPAHSREPTRATTGK